MIVMRPKLHHNCCSKFDKNVLKYYIREERKKYDELKFKKKEEDE